MLISGRKSKVKKTNKALNSNPKEEEQKSGEGAGTQEPQ